MAISNLTIDSQTFSSVLSLFNIEASNYIITFNSSVFSSNSFIDSNFLYSSKSLTLNMLNTVFDSNNIVASNAAI